MMRLLGYGAGDCFKLYHKNLDFDKVSLLAVLDGRPPEDGKFSYPLASPYEVPIVPLDTVNTYEFDYVIIFSYNNAMEMHDNLIRLQVPEEKILYAEMNDIVHHNYEILSQFCTNELNGFAVIDHVDKKDHKLKDFDKVSRTDFIRIATLELVANQIREKNIPGNLAEAGVFRGFFSSRMSELLPERQIYLFDTFEGFDDRDMEDVQTEAGQVTDINGFAYREFKDTSVELVLSQMPDKENCVVRKGYFPETAQGIPEDVKYALVSLDMDLYGPIYEGLKWFYPRMEQGGYILVHDYNNRTCLGVKEALDQFGKEAGVSILPIPDYCGTAIVVKQ